MQFSISYASCGDVAGAPSKRISLPFSSMANADLQGGKHKPIEPSTTFCEIAMDQFQQDRGENVMFQFCSAYPITMGNALYALIANKKVGLISHMAPVLAGTVILNIVWLNG